MRGLKCLVMVVVVGLFGGAVVASRASAQCFACGDDGMCIDGWARVVCFSTYAGGQWQCSLSGDYCVGGPGGGGSKFPTRVAPVGAPNAEGSRVTAHLLLAMPRAAWQRLFPTHQAIQVDMQGIPVGAAAQAFARTANIDASEMTLAGAALQFGNADTQVPVFEIGGVTRVAVEIERSGRASARVRMHGLSNPSVVSAGSVESGRVAIAMPVESGGRHFALLIWTTFAEMAREAKVGMQREVEGLASSASSSVEFAVVGNAPPTLKSWGAVKQMHR